jgi:hypothetical protein
MNWLPLAETFGELCPGTSFWPLLVHIMAAIPVASRSTVTSVGPNRLSVPLAISEPNRNSTDNPIPGRAETGETIRLAMRKTDKIDKILVFI